MGNSTVVATSFGSSALDRLADEVQRLKGDDPLAPVVVIVPNNIAGIVARRALAGATDGDRRGVAGLFVATLPRLAEQLAAHTLSPRRPATRPLVAAAWRSVLATHHGPFELVGEHPATVKALTATHRELRDLSETALDEVAARGELQSALVDLHRQVRGALAPLFYDETDLLAAATDLIATGRATPDGPVVLYLPGRLTNAETGFAQTIAQLSGITVIAGFTGDERADSATTEILHRLGANAPDRPDDVPMAHEIRHASDSDDEVRGVVRELVNALRATPAHRIAVLYTAASPYARLLHEQLAAAGLAFNGPGSRAVHDRAVGRAFLEVLALPDTLPRAMLFRALSRAPFSDPSTSERIPVARWERLSRAAGIVGGADWQIRLSQYLADRDAAVSAEQAKDDPQQSRIDQLAWDLAAATALRDFISALQARRYIGESASTWLELSGWALDLFHDLIGRPDELLALPPEEQYAAAVIETALRGFGSLATMEPTVGLTDLVQALDQELETARPRVGRFGEGIFVGPLSAAVGLDLDLVFVVGLSEDLYPGRMRVDPLLPDRVREAVAELAGPREALDRRHRDLLAAMSTGPRVVASFPRGDLRRSTLRLPSRWLLPSLRRLAGNSRISAGEWDRVRVDAVTGASSFARAMLTTELPATNQEWRTRAAAVGRYTDDPIDQAIELLRARAGQALSRYDGNLTDTAGLPKIVSSGRAVSPTQLEDYATCPHGYFMRRLLGVEPLEHPEEVLVISALDIGTLIHEAMDDFVTENLDALPGFGQPWTDAQARRLVELAAAKATEFETRGLTGHPKLWAAERARIMVDLGTMIADDNAWRAEQDARVVASELAFGLDGRPPVEVLLEGGGRVAMRGKADKVDQRRDGTLLVTDMKTGSPSRFTELNKDPIAGGTKLQLPVYGYAAQQQLGDHQVIAQYWFVRKGRKSGGPSRIGVTLDDALDSTYRRAVGTLATSIEAGLYPARAPEQADFSWRQCPYCNPDGLGHNDARERWERQNSDPVLAELVALIEPGDGQ